MSRGLSSRGRGGGRGTAKEDPYAFGGGEDDVLPLAQRIDWRLGAGKKSNDTEYLPDEEKEALQVSELFSSIDVSVSLGLQSVPFSFLESSGGQ